MKEKETWSTNYACSFEEWVQDDSHVARMERSFPIILFEWARTKAILFSIYEVHFTLFRKILDPLCNVASQWEISPFTVWKFGTIVDRFGSVNEYKIIGLGHFHCLHHLLLASALCFFLIPAGPLDWIWSFLCARLFHNAVCIPPALWASALDSSHPTAQQHLNLTCILDGMCVSLRSNTEDVAPCLILQDCYVPYVSFTRWNSLLLKSQCFA